MDDEIQETVEAILGKDVKVIDCEKKSTIKEEEVLLINGCPVTLDGEDGVAIKDALLRGNIPNCHSLNQILVRVGILKAPVKLETNLSVKSNVVTREEVIVARGGQVVDERSRETKEDNFYTSNTSEIWEPVGIISNDNLSSINSNTDKDFSSFLSTPVSYAKASKSQSVKSACDSGNSTNIDVTDSPRVQCSRYNAPKKYQETKMTSISKKFSSDPEDKTDFVYSSNTVSGASLKDASAVHILPLGPTLKNVAGTSSSSSFSSGLIFRDGTLVSGHLDALIQHLIPSADYYPDKEFIFAFLLTSRLFIKPDELMDKIVQLCDKEYNFNNKSPQNKEKLVQFMPRLVQLMGDWIESFPYDFRDDKLMAHVRSIMQKCVNVNPELLPKVSTLVRNLLECLTNLEHYEEFLQEVNQNSVKQSVDILSPVHVMELCSEPKILAQQLCHIELERLSYIGPEEFVQAFVQEHSNGECCTHTKKTCNLESYVQWFNRLSYLVGSEICRHMKKKARIKTVEYWVEVARESFNIGNFNSLMAIIAGLNLSPVARLKKTWAKVQSAKFSILEHQMNPTSNFSSYRSTLKAAMWRSTGINVQHQCLVIPFFSLLIKDIYFLNEGCANRLPNGHVNFEKFGQLAQQVSEFIKWKRTACPFEKNLQIITFLQASPVLSEKALLLVSFECEPPENSHEKEQYKLLKNGET